MVDVKGIEVSRESGEKHHVSFGHGPSRAFPLVADDQVIKTEDIE
jgi:hypothetical protein